MQSHDDGLHSPKGKEQTACMHYVRQWLWLQASLWQTVVPWGKGCRCELPQCWTRCQLCTFPPQQMRWWSTGSLSQSTATAKPTRCKTIWIHHINTRVCTKFWKAGKFRKFEGPFLCLEALKSGWIPAGPEKSMENGLGTSEYWKSMEKMDYTHLGLVKRMKKMD